MRIPTGLGGKNDADPTGSGSTSLNVRQSCEFVLLMVQYNTIQYNCTIVTHHAISKFINPAPVVGKGAYCDFLGEGANFALLISSYYLQKS